MNHDRNREPGPTEDAGTTPAVDSRETATMLYSTPLDLRWRDLDAFNHVNNSSFLTFLEEARIRWFASLGTEWVTDTIAPLLAAVQINYRRPIPYPSDSSSNSLPNASATASHDRSRIQSRDGMTLYADGHVGWCGRARHVGPLPCRIRAQAAAL